MFLASVSAPRHVAEGERIVVAGQARRERPSGQGHGPPIEGFGLACAPILGARVRIQGGGYHSQNGSTALGAQGGVEEVVSVEEAHRTRLNAHARSKNASISPAASWPEFAMAGHGWP